MEVVAYWEMAASFVLRDVLHPDVYLDTCDEGLFAYAVVEEHLVRIREVRPHFFARTEAVIQDGSGNIVYNLAQQDVVALRAVMRVGFALPNPVNRVQPSASERCAFAVLTA